MKTSKFTITIEDPTWSMSDISRNLEESVNHVQIVQSCYTGEAFEVETREEHDISEWDEFLLDSDGLTIAVMLPFWGQSNKKI
tara:strand:- start:847 stop:1095 length:249 start_codon:yes stop_codon:yes gene_type:complete